MLELKFLSGSLEFIDRKIDFFERNDAQIHNLYAEMGSILSRQIQVFMKESVLIKEIDEEQNVVYKQFKELLEVDSKNEANWKARSDISLGSQAEEYLKKLGLSKDSQHLNNFFKFKVFPFYSKIVEMLQKYFTKGLNSEVLAACSFLAPAKRNAPALLSKMKYLGFKYEKVLKQYSDSTNHIDEFESQVINYQRLEVEEAVLELPFNDYWMEIGKVTVGGEKRGLKLLSKFALGLGTQFNSNSKIERQFKAQSSIHTDKNRNKLEQDMFDSYLTIKSGVESLKIKELCGKCKRNAMKIADGEVKNPRPHCHCCYAKPSDKMMENCRTARRSYGKEIDEKKKNNKENEETLAERRKITEIKLRGELEQWRDNLDSRTTFLEDESLELPAVKSKQSKPAKKVAKQSSSVTPVSARNRVSAAKAKVMQVKRKAPQMVVPARRMRRKPVIVNSEATELIKDVATASTEEESAETGSAD